MDINQVFDVCKLICSISILILTLSTGWGREEYLQQGNKIMFSTLALLFFAGLLFFCGPKFLFACVKYLVIAPFFGSGMGFVLWLPSCLIYSGFFSVGGFILFQTIGVLLAERKMLQLSRLPGQLMHLVAQLDD